MLKQVAHEVRQSLDNEDGDKILADIRTIREKFEPEVVVKEDAQKTRRAKGLRKSW